MQPRRARALDLTVLAVLPFIIFWQHTVLRQSFLHGDLQYYYFPYRELVGSLIRSGTVSLWNQYAFAGIPLLADGQTAILFPLTWLFAIVPPHIALNLTILLQFSVAGTGFYLFARHLGILRSPALLSAILFMFSGSLTARVVQPWNMAAAALLPWVFLAVDCYGAHGGGRRYAGAVTAVTLQLLSGHPQVPAYSAIGLLLYLVCSTYGLTFRPSLMRFFTVYAAAAALTAVVLIPWAELALSSPRAHAAPFDFVFRGSLTVEDLLLFVIPFLHGSLHQGLMSHQPFDIHQGLFLWERSAYFGILGLAFAAASVLTLGRSTAADGEEQPRRAQRLTLSLACLAALGLLIALGNQTPFARLLFIVPVVGAFRDTHRALLLAVFAGSLLAGLGIGRWVGADRSSRRAMRIVRNTLLILALLLAGAFALAATADPPYRFPGLDYRRLNGVVPLFLLTVSAALLSFPARFRRGLGVAAAFVIVLIDMTVFAGNFNPVESPPRTTDAHLANFLRQDREIFRKVTVLTDLPSRVEPARDLLAISWNIPSRIQDLTGFNSLQPRRHLDLVQGPAMPDADYGVTHDQSIFHERQGILNLFNVKYVVVPRETSLRLSPAFEPVLDYGDGGTVFRNTHVLPRAFFPHEAHTVTGDDAVLEILRKPEFDARRLSVVEGDLPPFDLAGPTPTDPVITSYQADALAMTVHTSSPRLLVLSDGYSPGWRAAVNGREVPILRANYYFRGVVVPAGESVVTFEYRPWSVYIGAVISGLTLLSLAVAAREQRSLTS